LDENGIRFSGKKFGRPPKEMDAIDSEMERLSEILFLDESHFSTGQKDSYQNFHNILIYNML
jgi:hypothetical protein